MIEANRKNENYLKIINRSNFFKDSSECLALTKRQRRDLKLNILKAEMLTFNGYITLDKENYIRNTYKHTPVHIYTHLYTYIHTHRVINTHIYATVLRSFFLQYNSYHILHWINPLIGTYMSAIRNTLTIQKDV